MLATLTLRALLLLGEPSPRFSRRPLTFRVACRHPQPPPCGESWSYAPLSRSRPTYADDLATTDSSNRQLALPTRSSGSVAFPRRIRREPTCQSRTCAIAVKRLRSLDPERLPPYRPSSSLHPKTTPPLNSYLNHEDDANTVSSMGFAAGRVRRLSTESID